MSTHRPIIIDQADLGWEGWDDPTIAAKSAIRWKVLIAQERCASSGLVMGVAEIPPGAQLLLHHHEPEETYYVVGGTGHIEIDDHAEEIRPGSAVYIPANAKHALRCTSAEPLVLVFAFPRDRFDQVDYHFDV